MCVHRHFDHKSRKTVKNHEEMRNLQNISRASYGTIMCTNNEKNDQFYWKVAFLMYSERVNFRPQNWKEASKLKPHRGLGTRFPSP